MDNAQEGGVKNWWKVGDGHVHWGHDHWGSPHHVHHGGGGWEYGHTGMKHGHGHFRNEVKRYLRGISWLPFSDWLFEVGFVDRTQMKCLLANLS